MTIWTVGHSTLDTHAFFRLLRTHGIAMIADVRRFPGSRRNPQFGRAALTESLPEHGIGYEHIEALGGKRAAARDSPNTGLHNEQFRSYADHMATTVFIAGLERLLELGRAASVAAMCAEAVPWRCHRNLLADALVARSVEVAHIIDEDEPKPHALHASASVWDGTVTYPPAQTALEL